MTGFSPMVKAKMEKSADVIKAPSQLTSVNQGRLPVSDPTNQVILLKEGPILTSS